MRVVSLLPSATEVVYALGVEPVGVSHECDHPPAAADVPAMNRSRVDADADTAAVNAQVAEAAAGDGVYELDRAALRRADPDLIISQGVCDVCAVDDGLVREAVADLGLDAEVLTTHPHSLDDVLADVERVGAALGREDRAAEFVADLRARVDAVREHAAASDGRPSVAVLDWTDPVMVAAHWVPEMVAAAGGTYPLADPGERSRPREWVEVREADPDALVVAPCGFSLARTLDNRSDLANRSGWDDLTAVREGRAYAMDGHHYLNRPGPRLVDSLEHLAGLLHSEAFAPPPSDVARRLPGPDEM